VKAREFIKHLLSMENYSFSLEEIISETDSKGTSLKLSHFLRNQEKTQNKRHGIKALYRITSEYEEIRLRLKLEINCKEHLNILVG
jgi:hypothetical protein